MPADAPQPPEPRGDRLPDDHTRFVADAEPAAGATPPDELPLTVDLPTPGPPTNGNPAVTLSQGRAAAGPATTPEAGPGRSVPGYEILDELGRGGMGVVYKARHLGLDRLVALKMILSGAHAGPAERERFRREAHAVAALQHSNIVQVFDVGEVHGCPYLALELVEGGSLAARLEGNPWPARDAAALVETLARAMQFAHAKGVVHRDLKPSNILLSGADLLRPRATAGEPQPAGRLPEGGLRDVTPKVTDFGLAKRVEPDSPGSAAFADSAVGQTRSGAVMGTPSYIAPEQAAGKSRQVGPAADVYALGAVLYELLTGRPPFRGETPLETVLQVTRDDPIPPSRLRPKVPRDLETICLKCLQKHPSRRYAGAAELADDLQRFLNGHPITARPIGYGERLVKWARRHPAAATWGTFAAITVLVLLGVSVYFNVELREAADREQNKARQAENAQRAAEAQGREALRQQRIADGERRKAEQQREAADREREKAERAHGEVRRGAYALLLAQSAALAERDPKRGLELLTQPKRCPPDLRDFTWRYLRRACDRQTHASLDAGGPVGSAAFSPNGTLVAAGSWDRAVRVYDARTFAVRAVLEGHDGPVLALAFSPDGCCLATAGDDRTVRVWDLPGELHLPAVPNPPPALGPWATLATPGGSARCVAFGPDGRTLAAGGDDGLVRLWQLPAPRRATGAVAGAALFRFGPVGELRVPEPALLKGHSRGVRTLAFNPSAADAELATGGEDHAVRLWKLTPSPGDGRLLHTFGDAVNCVAWSPDGVTLAVATNSEDDPSVHLWDKEEGVEIGRLQGHTKTVYAVAFGVEGKLLASGASDRLVRLWEVETQEERTVFRGHDESVRTVAFSPDRRHLISGGLDRSVREWSVFPPREETVPLAIESPAETAAVSPDGKLLALGERNGLVKVWRLGADHSPEGEPAVLKGHVGFVSALAFGRDGRALASAGRDGTVRVWDMTLAFAAGGAGSEEHRFPRQGLVRDLAFDPSGALVAGGESGLRVLDIGHRRARTLPVRGGRVRALALAPDGRHAACTSGTFLQVWDLQTGRLAMEATLALAHTRDVTTLALESPAGPRKAPGWILATADDSGFAMLWDLGPREGGGPLELKPRAQLPGHGERVESFAFSRDGRTLATASRDRTVKLWDPVAGPERATLNGHSGPVVLAAFAPDGSALLTLGAEGRAKVWLAPPARR